MNEELEALRELTKLNPIAYAKVMKARKEAELYRDLYVKYHPNAPIEVDYSTADELEFSLRMNALERIAEKGWKKYIEVEKDGYGLNQYTNDLITQHINSKQSKSR